MEQLTQAPDPTFLLTIAGLAIAALLVLIIKLTKSNTDTDT